MVKYFCDFRELHRDHETFCHKNFLTVPLSSVYFRAVRG